MAPVRPILLPDVVHRWLDAAARAQLEAAGSASIDFTGPPGEPALAAADSVSWQVFKNPIALFIGGVAAVILELAEPRIRSGIWEHSGFRRHPLGRLQRTGLAAMVTVYGARSSAQSMIAQIRRMHEGVRGVTPCGRGYHANDPELLRWVQATAAFGFLEAYCAYVRPLPRAERDRYYAEGEPAARLYGAAGIPTSELTTEALFAATYGTLERSGVVFDFLDIMSRAELLPAMIRPAQGILVRAAVEITPAPARRILGLGHSNGLSRWEAAAVRRAGALADRILLRSSPPVQACLRLGLPADHLFGGDTGARQASGSVGSVDP